MSNVFEVDNTTIRTLIYNLQMEVKSLKNEVEELKKNKQSTNLVGFKVGPNVSSAELAFPRLYSGGEKPP